MGQAKRRGTAEERTALAIEKRLKEEEEQRILREKIEKEKLEHKRKCYRTYHEIREWIENNYDTFLEAEGVDVSHLFVNEESVCSFEVKDIHVFKRNNGTVRIGVGNELLRDIKIEKVYDVDEEKEVVSITEIKGKSSDNRLLLAALTSALAITGMY